MGKNKITDEIAGLTANSVKKVKDVAEDLTNKISVLSKENSSAIQKDVSELINWVSKRNNELQQEAIRVEQTDFENLPALGKVIFGGEAGIKELPVDERSKYVEYFKKNGSRITMLTAVNPILGLGTFGVEAAANGLVSTETSVGTATVGAGLIGLSKLAIASVPSCASVSAISKMLWYVPGLQYVGAGLFALGTGAMLFKAIEKLPQGKMLADLFTETQKLHNDCYIQLENNIVQVGDVLATRIKGLVEKLETTSKKIAISIDDALHSDQNLRLMQYSDITLRLYQNQVEIQKQLDTLINEYNTLVIKNQELTKEILEYRMNLQLLVCSGEYLK